MKKVEVIDTGKSPKRYRVLVFGLIWCQSDDSGLMEARAELMRQQIEKYFPPHPGTNMSEEKKTLKAYKVHCKDDDHGAVIDFGHRGRDCVFANSDHCDCEFIDRLVHRAKDYDKYAPGPVTIPQYLSEGWWWTCAGCGGQVSGDEQYVLIRDHVFCTEDCLRKCLEQDRDSLGPDRSKWHHSMVEFVKAMEEHVLSLVSHPESP